MLAIDQSGHAAGSANERQSILKVIKESLIATAGMYVVLAAIGTCYILAYYWREVQSIEYVSNAIVEEIQAQAEQPTGRTDFVSQSVAIDTARPETEGGNRAATGGATPSLESR